MELCPACEAERPAASALIRWYRAPDRDPRRCWHPKSSATGPPHRETAQ
ncbi:DUF6300 family protein [Streptomyces canus]